MSHGLRRHPRNPILTRRDVPDIHPDLNDVSSVFNPGATEHRGRFHLLLRVQSRGRTTRLLKAESHDGVEFQVARRPVEIEGLATLSEPTAVDGPGTEADRRPEPKEPPNRIYHVYDPRITRIDRLFYVTLAVDTDTGCRMGVAKSDDLKTFELVGFTEDADTRNGVLFPERVDGAFLRLDRPNTSTPAVGAPTGDRIVLSESDDLLSWRPRAVVMEGRPRFWDERIGSGPPPIKTREGWLHIYHGVATHFAGANIYQAGAILLDLADPSRLIARTRQNILEPREAYELIGQVPNVVFPSGLIAQTEEDAEFAEPDDRLFVYYGAADTCIGLAITRVGDLLQACRE